MSLLSPKTVAVAATLAGTWAMASADPVNVTYTSTYDVENAQIYTEHYNYGTSVDGVYVPGAPYEDPAHIRAELGTIAANTPGSTTIDLSYDEGTSVVGGMVGTAGTSIVLGLRSVDTELAEPFLESTHGDGTWFDTVYNAVLSGDADTLHEAFSTYEHVVSGDFVPFDLYHHDSNTGLDLADASFGPYGGNTFSFYQFSRDGGDVTMSASSGAGAFGPNIDAVPEPTSMAALGFGALAFLRRRRKS